MNKAALKVLKYLWVGFRVDPSTRCVFAPNGKVVARVLDRTITELVHHCLIALDPVASRYRLTDAGRQRVLVKERVRDFVDSITHSPT